MSDYEYYGKQKRRSKRGDMTRGGAEPDNSSSLLLWILDVVMSVFSILLMLVFVAAFMARWISPEKMPMLAVFGLFYPFIYVANVVCMLYWAMRWSKMFWCLLVVVMLGWGSVKKFYRPELVKQYQTEQQENYEEQEDKEGFVVMSYNVVGFWPQQEEDREDLIEKIAALAEEKAASVVCFQEFNNTQSNTDRMETALRNLRYSSFVNYDFGDQAAYGGGMAVYSAYPIINSGVVDMGTQRVHSMWVDLKVDSDTIRVISNHLQSTHVTKQDRDETITAKIINDTTASEKVMSLAHKLAENYSLRAAQAKCLREFIKESPYEVIVCGDFNDTAGSYVYRKIARRLKDTFTEQGVGYVYTFRDFMNLLRIDYIFVSDGFKVHEYEVPEVKYSDHLPVLSRVQLVDRRGD